MQRNSNPAENRSEILELLKQGRAEGILIHLPFDAPMLSHCRLPPLPPIVDIREPFTWTTSEDADFANLTPPFILPPEKLTIDANSLAMINSLDRLRIDENAELDRLLSEEAAAFNKVKKECLEAPLVDGVFENQSSIGTQIPIPEPLEVAEDGHGGLRWPQRVVEEVEAFEKKLRLETLVVSQEVIGFLTKICPKTTYADDFDELFEVSTSRIALQIHDGRPSSRD